MKAEPLKISTVKVTVAIPDMIRALIVIMTGRFDSCQHRKPCSSDHTWCCCKGEHKNILSHSQLFFSRLAQGMRSTPTWDLATPSELPQAWEPRTTRPLASAEIFNKQEPASHVSRAGSTPYTPSRPPGTQQTWLPTTFATWLATKLSSHGSWRGTCPG